MKKSLLRLAMLGLPVLFTAACGVDQLFGSLDGGATGACPAGVTVYQISSGPYKSVVGSGSVLSDTCQTGTLNSEVEGTRNVGNDAQGNIVVKSSDNTTPVGTGPVRCNTGTLTYQETAFQNDGGPCLYKYTNSVDFTVTSANTFSMVVTQTRTESKAVSGQTCNQSPTSCILKYSVNLAKQ